MFCVGKPHSLQPLQYVDDLLDEFGALHSILYWLWLHILATAEHNGVFRPACQYHVATHVAARDIVRSTPAKVTCEQRVVQRLNEHKARVCECLGAGGTTA